LQYFRGNGGCHGFERDRSMAHDIRNTLGTVSLYLESLERSSPADPAIVLTRSDALLKQAASMCSDLMREVG